MKYLLDTNICIALLNKKEPKLTEKFKVRPVSEFALCSVVKAELLYGARHSSKPKENLELLKFFFNPFESLPFDDVCAAQYGTLRAQLQASGRPIGANDMLIASVAMSHNLTLLTRNTKEFERVPDLQLEVW